MQPTGKMEVVSDNRDTVPQNPKLVLLQRIKKQRSQNAKTVQKEEIQAKSEKPAQNPSQDIELPSKKIVKTYVREKSPTSKPTKVNEQPGISNAFLDEFEKSVKIIKNANAKVRAISKHGRSSKNGYDSDISTTPEAVSINDLKGYIDNLCKPNSVVTLYQKENCLKSRLLCIKEISKSLSSNLLSGKHLYNIGVTSTMVPGVKGDIYEATNALIDEYRLSHEKQSIRYILIDFLTFFSNVLISKDVGITSYVIEQSIKTGVFSRLLELSTNWTDQSNASNDNLTSYQSYPADVTLKIQDYLKEKEDQLTATWKQINEKENIMHTLPIIERCLGSPARFDGTYPISMYELSVSDYSVAGVQPDSNESQVKPLATVLANQFPSYFDKYRTFAKEDCTSDSPTKETKATGNGLVSFYRVFSTGHALVSLGMRRRKYFETLNAISENIAVVFANPDIPDFGTLSMYMPANQDPSSEEDQEVPYLNSNKEKSVPSNPSLENFKMYVVMTEDLWFESERAENKQNVPKYLAQIDFLRAYMLKPKDIKETYRGLNNNNFEGSNNEWAYVYLLDVGIVARVKVTSLLVIKTRSILKRKALLSFVKVRGLDPSIDLDVSNACARVICHILEDPESHRSMMKNILMRDSAPFKIPSMSCWRRLLVEKNQRLGLQALSIKAFRCISQDHHDKSCNNVEEMPVNDSEFHMDMCKYIAEFVWSLLFIHVSSSKYENIAQSRSIMDAMYTLYYTMDLMPEARLKRTFEECKIHPILKKILDPHALVTDKNETEGNIIDLVSQHENSPMRRQLEDMVLSLAEKIQGFENGGNALMRRLTNQRLTSSYQRRAGSVPTNSRELSNRNSNPGNAGRGYQNRILTDTRGGRRRSELPESEGGPINTGGGIVPNSRSQAHQLAIKAGIPGFNQPVYRSKADIDPEVRYSTVGQAGVTTKAIAFRTAEDKYIEQLENLPGNSSMAMAMKEKTPIVDRAKELETNSRWQQEEEPIDYESLINYADIAEEAAPENVVALPDMKSSRRLKQEIVALLNENRGGQILMGVNERSNGGAGLVNGVFLDRRLKDKLRQEMDGIPKQITPDPLPDRRIGQPVFIPVRYNPRVNNQKEKPYVIRVAIRPKVKEQSPKGGKEKNGTENQVYYKLRDEPNPMIRLNGKTVEGIYLNIQKKILQNS